MKEIIRVLREYEDVSGQLINKEKSSAYMYQRGDPRLLDKVVEITGFSKGKFPFTYLACPIFHSRRKNVYYNEIIKKVKQRIQNWKGKLLS